MGRSPLSFHTLMSRTTSGLAQYDKILNQLVIVLSFVLLFMIVLTSTCYLTMRHLERTRLAPADVIPQAAQPERCRFALGHHNNDIESQTGNEVDDVKKHASLYQNHYDSDLKPEELEYRMQQSSLE
ncbi:hypothetical protein VKT23_006053 [Stygiomarasmius scandens]|uniref:Uncharacterized protein n=1 Tax=Marasmiellus scandens TaxID=2682957 RepID=A0ABR1JP78_9AGAR